MRGFFGWIALHPRPVLAAACAVALAAGAFVFRLRRDTSPDAFIPPGHPALAQARQVEELFGLRDPIVVGVICERPEGIFNPETLRLIQELTRAIEGLPGVEPGSVASLSTASGVRFQDGEPTFERFLGNIPRDRRALAALREEVLSYELYRGTFVSADGSAACLLIRSPPPGERADAVYRSLRDLVDRYPCHGESLVVAGEAAVRAHMGKAVSDDALRMNFVCPAVMALLIALAYRTLRGTVLPLCVIGGASATALGLMGAAGVPVYIVTNGIFVVIMALGIADSLHLLGQYYEEQLAPRGRSAREMAVDASMALWFPLLVTSLTDLAGFLALYVGGLMPPIRYFGLFTCAGVAGALLYSYTVVPAALAVLPLRSSPVLRSPAAGREGVRMDAPARWLGRLGVLACRNRRTVVALGAAGAVLAFWGGSRVVINDARLLAFKDGHPIVQSTRVLNERFDGTSLLSIVVRASRPGLLLEPEALRRIEALESFSEGLPFVGGTHSLAGWVKRAHQKMHGEDPAYHTIPGDREDTRFYLDTLRAPGCPLAWFLREVVDPSYSRTQLVVRMKTSEFIHQRRVVEPLERYLEERFNGGGLEASLAGRVNLDYHWLQLIRRSHRNSVLFSFACVLLLTAAMFRSLAAGLLCALVVGAAVLVNYAFMGFCGIPLGVGTSMFASIAIGAGVNFPIHLLDRMRLGLRRAGAGQAEAVFRETLSTTGRALFFTALVVAAGFGLLAVSEFRTLVEFGLLIALGILASFAVSVTLLPALVALLRPRAIWGPREGGGRLTGPPRGAGGSGSPPGRGT